MKEKSIIEVGESRPAWESAPIGVFHAPQL